MSLFRSQRESEARMQAFVSSIPAPTRAAAVDVRAVQAIDATFDLNAFMTGAASLFRDVRAAFNTGSLDPVAGRLSPELTAIMGKQLQYATATARQQNMTSIDDLSVELLGIDVGSAGEILTVVRYDVVGRLGLVMLNATVPAATQLAGLPQRSWFEVWRLARPAGISTPPPAAVCSSCGAPATGGTHCRFCHALLVDATVGFHVVGIECMG